MDELFDLFEGLSDLLDLGDFDSLGGAFGELLEAAELPEFDPEWLMELAELPAPEDLAEVAGPVEGGSGAMEATDAARSMFATLPSGEVVELLVPSPETAPRLISEGVASYPPEALAHLNQIAYTHDAVVPASSHLGDWSIGPGGAEINLHGNSQELWSTLHHEIGHHVVETNPELKADLLDSIATEGFAEDRAAFLEQYSPELRGSEACAEAIAQFKSNPPAFAALYPQTASLLEARVSA